MTIKELHSLSDFSLFSQSTRSQPVVSPWCKCKSATTINLQQNAILLESSMGNGVVLNVFRDMYFQFFGYSVAAKL